MLLGTKLAILVRTKDYASIYMPIKTKTNITLPTNKNFRTKVNLSENSKILNTCCFELSSLCVNTGRYRQKWWWCNKKTHSLYLNLPLKTFCFVCTRFNAFAVTTFAFSSAVLFCLMCSNPRPALLHTVQNAELGKKRTKTNGYKRNLKRYVRTNVNNFILRYTLISNRYTCLRRRKISYNIKVHYITAVISSNSL